LFDKYSNYWIKIYLILKKKRPERFSKFYPTQ